MQGIYLPLMTPFSCRGALQLEKIPAMVEHHIRQGVDGFYVGGSSSECFMMSGQERQQVLAAVASANQGRLPLIAHVGAIALHEVKTLIDCAVSCEYDAISATPPFYYGFSRAEVEHYYRTIADYSRLPLLLYNIPGTTGVDFSHQQLINLSFLDNVVGIKHTTSDMFFIERLRNSLPDSTIFHGEDTMLVNGLQMGASGGIGSTYNLMSRHYVELYQAMISGELELAMSIQKRVNRVTEVLLEVGVYQGIKYAMCELGIDYGVCREPFLPLDPSAKQKITDMIETFDFN